MKHLGRRTTAPHHTRARRFALTGCAAVAVATLAIPDDPATVGPDWCWQYYTLAPVSALVTDLGPANAEAVDEWHAWLTATVDAPIARRRAQSEQLQLVDELRSSGAWTTADAHRYQEAAASDPSPATVCESFGSRIIPEPDGALPHGWADRFIDSRDAAFSQLASGQRQGS